jgi:hypothetical protein
VKQQAELKPNQTTIATITLKRWIDLPSLRLALERGTLASNHVLAGVYMTMEDCRLYAEAGDIRVANLLISNTDADHVYHTEYFCGGKPDPLSTKDYLLVVQQEFRNTSAKYGHMPLLGIFQAGGTVLQRPAGLETLARLPTQLHHRQGGQGSGWRGLLHSSGQP